MIGIKRTRIDHRPPDVATAVDQVGVGSGTRHHAAVICGYANDARRQPHRNIGLDIVARMSATFGIEAADLGVCMLTRRHRLRAVLSATEPRQDTCHLAGLARPSHQCIDGAKIAEGLQKRARWRHQAEAVGTSERIGQSQPLVRDHLDTVVRNGLVCRHFSHEESGVESLRPTGRRQPVREVRQPLGHQSQIVVGTQFAHRSFAAVEWDAP